MDRLNTTKLTVAKICHEIANHLSIIKFLYNDVDTETDELNELSIRIDLLVYTMDFFRGLYSSGCSVTNMLDTILNIAKLNKILISDERETLEELVVLNSKTFILGILYLIMKVCKPKDTIIISSKATESITISVDKPRIFPKAVYLAFNDDSSKEDVFNILVLYVKYLAKEQGFKISADFTENGGLRVNVWQNPQL